MDSAGPARVRSSREVWQWAVAVLRSPEREHGVAEQVQDRHQQVVVRTVAVGLLQKVGVLGLVPGVDALACTNTSCSPPMSPSAWSGSHACSPKPSTFSQRRWLQKPSRALGGDIIPLRLLDTDIGTSSVFESSPMDGGGTAGRRRTLDQGALARNVGTSESRTGNRSVAE